MERPKNMSKSRVHLIKAYFRENRGAPFILGFMLLLIVAAVSLLMGLAVLAEVVAVCAYCALVFGVVLQLVCSVKFGEKGGNKD